MSIQIIDEKLFNYLIKDISGQRFETLAKGLLAAEIGEEFIPLGGMHDGGADGYLELDVTSGKKPGTYFQFSITEKGRAQRKIQLTINSLKKVGREPSHLVYATNELLPKQDLLREEIFDTHHVLLTVKDAERLKQLVNSDQRANEYFLRFFTADIAALKHSAENLRGSINQFVTDPTVFAFLDYELKERFAKDHLLDKILDSLIYWALRDTDPDANVFMSRLEMASAINSVFPTAVSILNPKLNARLTELSKKGPANEERIRHYKSKDLFCLPFVMRKQLAERALEEAGLQEDFLGSVKARLLVLTKHPLSDDVAKAGTDLVFESVHDYFVEQGLILAAFLENKVGSINISDQIIERQVAKVIQKLPNKVLVSPSLVEDALKVLREVFYMPSEVERRYLGYLSRTSLLFMTLQKAPRMVEYFNQMGGNFRLLIGSDVIIKAMSEQQLHPEGRQVDVLLNACIEIGAKLILTETVLSEIFTHLHAVDLEYRNHYLPNEQYLSIDVVSECDRIFIRSYFYCRLDNGRFTWDKFINQFIDPKSLRNKSQKGMDELKGWLMQHFGMEYLTKEEMGSGVNIKEVDALTIKLDEARTTKNAELSYNDALMVHTVYRQRILQKEAAIYDGFGYRTWWLTKETKVLEFTGGLVAREGGVPYIMRPEFILNFIALAPKAANVRKSFRDLLPTTVGLQLGQHLKPDDMHKLLSGTEEWASLSPERVNVIIGERVNRLKHDRLKQYLTSM